MLIISAIAALGGYIDAHRVEKPDIWPDRYVDLDPAAAGAGGLLGTVINFENLLSPVANPFNAFQDALLIDMRTVLQGEDRIVEDALVDILTQEADEAKEV